MTTPERNYNDPRTHVHLVKLLDRPDALVSETRTRVLKQLRQSLDIAMAMPEGDARINLLDTLNTALGDALRFQQAHAEVQILHAKFKADHPDAAEVSSHVDVLQRYLHNLHHLAKEAQTMDKANGTDVDRTAWFWFVHELYRTTEFMNDRLKTLERTAGLTIVPPADSE